MLVKFFNILVFLFFLLCVYCYFQLRWYRPDVIPPNLWKKDYSQHISDKPDNIFWFVQVSDIHVSRYYDLERVPDLKRFSTETLDAIKPDIVLVTGDLTDAKNKDLTGSMQYEDEWETYQKFLEETKVTEKYVWLDIKGNHDTFNVMTENETENLYLKYSGDRGKKSKFVYNVEKSFGKYSFIHVNATLVPGPKRPYNFLGYLDQNSLNNLEEIAYNSKQKKSNLTFWYSHFPTSTITCQDSGRLRTLLSHYGSVYMCGHLHDLAGLANNMYAIHPHGFLEAELADWKVNRKYRIVSVDHDLVNFVDVRLDEWPVVLITCPKPHYLSMPRFEPLHRMKNSSHIRFLVFDTVAIKNVEIYIDGILLDEIPFNVEGPLWACKWNVNEYSEGSHKLKIVVRDELSREQSSEVFFCLESQQSNHHYKWSSVFFLITDVSYWVPIVHYTLIIIMVTCLFLIRTFPLHQIPSKSSHFFSISRNLFKLSIILNDDFAFNSFIVYLVNILTGPLFIGELVTGHIGVAFSYGIYLDKKFYDNRQLYLSTIHSIIFAFLPLLLYLSTVAECRWRDNLNFGKSWQQLSSLFTLQIFMLFTWAGLFWCSINMAKSYGPWAFWANFQYTWWLLWSLVLIYREWTKEKVVLMRTKSFRKDVSDQNIEISSNKKS